MALLQKRINILWEVVDGNSNVYKDPKVVMDGGDEFDNLLNPARVMQQDINTYEQSQQGPISDPYISYLEINKVVTHMNLG